MEWKDLNILDKSKWILFFVSQGITDKSLMLELYESSISNNEELNTFRTGGSIEIKHPGRLTELKERTGKTEAELWATGNPDYRKMITFARNSRLWHKNYDGGHLFATGNPLFDWDPDNPYHYHNANGEKVVVTPEDWKKHKGLPYFKQVEDAVLAEQAAHPGPEYIINPQFSEDLRSVYKGNMGHKYQNYSSFSSNLPQGYSFTPEGLVLDNQGNLYVLKGFRQSPRFTYDESNPFTFPVLEGKNQGNVTFYPVNMEKTVKQALPVSYIMDVDNEHESAIKKAQNQYEYIVTPWDILPNHEGGFSGYGDTYENHQLWTNIWDDNFQREVGDYLSNLFNRPIELNRTAPEDTKITITPKEFELVKKKLKDSYNEDNRREIENNKEWYNKYKDLHLNDTPKEQAEYKRVHDEYQQSLLDWINQSNPWTRYLIDGSLEDQSPKPRRISRKEAEKKAVIEVGPLLVNNIETFDNGGHLYQGINNSKLAEINNAMHYSGGSHNPLEIIYNNNVMPSQNYYNGTHYPGQYISNIEELLPNGRDHINLYTYGDQKGFEKFNNPTPITVNGQTYNYDLYNGNILPIDTLFLQKDITQPVIDSMIKNNDILGLNTDYFLVPANKDEYPTIYNNIYNYPNVDLNTVLDDTRNVSMSPKRDKNGNYYADVFDIIDFNNTLGVAGNYLDKQAKKAGAYGPYILRLQIPIKFTSGKSNGKMLGLLSSLNKNGKTWESLLLKYSKYYKQLRNNNQYPAIPKASGGHLFQEAGLLNRIKPIEEVLASKEEPIIVRDNTNVVRPIYITPEQLSQVATKQAFMARHKDVETEKQVARDLRNYQRDLNAQQYGTISEPQNGEWAYAWRRLLNNYPRYDWTYLVPGIGTARFGVDIGEDLYSGNYDEAAINLLAAEALGYGTEKLLGFANNTIKPFIYDMRIANKIRKNINATTLDLPLFFKPPKEHIRTRIGDVEIDNPNMFYRLGDGNLVDDLFNSGIIRTQDTGNKQIIGTINLTKPVQSNAMFNRGQVAFDPESNMGKYLVTTSASDKMQFTLPKTWSGNSVYINDWKNNPITVQEASGYIFEPGYGYRRVSNIPNTSYAFFERPSILTEAERLGIPKSERNQYFNSGNVQLAWRGTATSYRNKANYSLEHSPTYSMDYFFPGEHKYRRYAEIYGEPHLFAFPEDIPTLTFDAKGRNFGNLGHEEYYIPEETLAQLFNEASNREIQSLRDVADYYGLKPSNEELSLIQKSIHNGFDDYRLKDGDFSKMFYRENNEGFNPIGFWSMQTGKPIEVMGSDLWKSGQPRHWYEDNVIPELNNRQFRSIDGIGNYLSRHSEIPYDAVKVINVSDWSHPRDSEFQTLLMFKKHVPRVFIKQNGGKINWDNMGLLNPKLKGKITGIVGTKQGTPITMENVDIDLIGKDNLGNIQYMTEGNNYFFPGEYVVEYPVNTHSRQYGGVVKNTQNFIAPYLQDLVSRHSDNFTYLPQYMQDYVLKDVAYVNPNQYERPNQLLVNLVTPLQSKLKRSLSDYVDKNKLDYMQTVWDYLDKYNMSPYNRAALMGNIMLESSFNPKAKNPKSSAYGLFLMLDTPRNKAYAWMNQNKITDKDLGQIDWYVHLMNDNIDEYMDEYNNFMSRWDKVRQQYELNPSSTNKKYMDLYQSYYDTTYKNRVDNNEMWSVLDLNNTWNNINSSLEDRTRMFERVFEKAGPGSEHLKRINYANDILDYFFPDHIAVDAMKKDPLNYINGEFQYDEFGEPIKKQYGGLIKPFSYNTIPVVRF